MKVLNSAIALCFLCLIVASCGSQKGNTMTTVGGKSKDSVATVPAREKSQRASDRDTTGFSKRNHPGMIKEQVKTYKCCYGDYTSSNPETCPTHKIDLITVGTYYCPKCDGVISTKPGQCPVHHSDLKQMQ